MRVIWPIVYTIIQSSQMWIYLDLILREIDGYSDLERTNEIKIFE